MERRVQRLAEEKDSPSPASVSGMDFLVRRPRISGVDHWRLAGSRPDLYAHTLEYDPALASRKVRSLRYTGPTPPEEGFGTTMQMFLADKYLGKRVRFSANVRTVDVQGWAGLWMRVDVWVRVDGMSNRMSLAFDNMQDRPIRGTTDWTDYAVVLDATPDAKLIALGVLLTGPGQVWMRDARVEVVELGVPTTGVPQLLSDFME